MKAAWLRDWNDLELEDRPVPQIGPGEVLIKVHYAGICGSDLHVYTGHHSTAIRPVIMGHEFSGEVAELSEECHLKIGDRVVVQPYTSCGMCDACVQGRDNVCTSLKIFGIHRDGCFAQYIKVPIKKAYKIPEGIDYKLAAMAEPLAVAVHDIRLAGLSVGQTALIIGGGPIGILLALVARRSGAYNIVISEINEYRIKVARGMGFTVLNPLEVDVRAQANKMTGGRGFDVVFEATGSPQGAELMMAAVKTCGTIVIIGISRKKPEIDTGAILERELKLIGVRIHAQRNFVGAVYLLPRMKTELESLITHEYSLDEINKAFDYAINGTDHIKIMIKI